MTGSSHALRPLPTELRERYLAEQWWTDETLGGLVDRSLLATPDARIRVWSKDRPWQGTYGQIRDDALRLAEGLRSAGVEPGEVVAFQLPNWHEALVAFYGLALGGYVLVPIVHIYGRKEVEFILGQSGAVAYLSASSFGHVDYLSIVDECADGLDELRLHVVIGDEAPAPGPDGVEQRRWSDLTAGEAAAGPVGCDADDIVVLAYTSGTTSDPKGVIHTHHTLLAELMHMAPWISPDMPNLMGSPVTHATGMLGAVLAPMQVGQDINVIDRWDPEHVLDIMLEADLGAGTGASVFLASLLYHPGFTPDHAARMQRIGLGGAPVPMALADHAASYGIAIIRAYGSTEHPSISGCTFDHPRSKRHGTDGAAMVGVEMRIVDEDGASVAAGVPGEILSRGPDLCMGYTDTALNDATFDADGWYRTGDMGVLDGDGFLTITDRVKDIIIRGGENISAAEVEEALAQMPQVVEVAVVAAPDERLGEHGCALVLLAPTVDDLDLDQVRSHLEGVGLARQKWPEELRVVDDFPRTGTGKIRKVDLRRQLRDQA